MTYNRKLEFVDERLTTIQIFYYMPKHIHLVQEFVWQFNDVPPKFNRAHEFLNYWKSNIDAVIKEIYLANATISNNTFINAKDLLRL
jgi:uncharacterized protein Usg